MSSQTDQPAPKPLTAEEEARWREGYRFLANAKTDCTCAICLSPRIVATLDASRAETAALRESLAAAEKMVATWRIRTEAHRQGVEGLETENARLAAELAEAAPSGVTCECGRAMVYDDPKGSVPHGVCPKCVLQRSMSWMHRALDAEAELAAARKVVADVIRWLECGAEAMAKTARPGDSRFGEALAEVVAAVAARDSGKARGGGTDAR